jgi:hypothetical protein
MFSASYTAERRQKETIHHKVARCCPGSLLPLNTGQITAVAMQKSAVFPTCSLSVDRCNSATIPEREIGKILVSVLSVAPEISKGDRKMISTSNNITRCQYFVSVSRGWTQFASKSIATVFRPRRAARVPSRSELRLCTCAFHRMADIRFRRLYSHPIQFPSIPCSHSNIVPS